MNKHLIATIGFIIGIVVSLAIIFNYKAPIEKPLQNDDQETISAEQLLSELENDNPELAESDKNQEPEQTFTYTAFKGAWFDVEYPEGFTVNPGLTTTTPGSTTPHQVDSATFTSPDNKVSFYIFAPMRGSGQPDLPADYQIQPNETLISSKTETDESGYRVYNYYTYKNETTNAWRSVLDITQIGNIDKVTYGISYSDQAAYNEYRPAYLHFKDSLVQYYSH